MADKPFLTDIKTLVWQAPVEVTSDANAPRELKVQGKVAAD